MISRDCNLGSGNRVSKYFAVFVLENFVLSAPTSFSEVLHVRSGCRSLIESLSSPPCG